MKVIKTDGLTKYYGKSRGIIDVNLSVEQGDIFGFIGPNGAGKSTTIRTLLGLIKPSEGRAEIFGKDCSKEKVAVLSNVGYMPGEAVFWDNMKISEIFSLFAGLRKGNFDSEINNLCDRFEIDTNKKIRELSLGNRKKVAIVSAFFHHPDLYVLDEPTGGLDPLMQKEFFSLIEERNAEGATVFLSSHILSEIGKHCKNAAIVKEGKIIACDSVENLMKTSVKRVTVQGITDVSGLSNIKNQTASENSVSFLYGGNVCDLMKKLIDLKVNDVTITEPDIEETFLHFYEKGGIIR